MGAVFIILGMVLINRSASWITVLLAGAAFGQDTARPVPDVPPAESFIPMTQTEKLRYNIVNSFQVRDFLQTALGSGLAQWRDSPYEWGQGWDAYGHRYWSRFAQHLVKRAVLTGVQLADGEDPRRLRSVRTGLLKRTHDAVKYTFVTQRNDGSRGFAYSRVIASYVGGFVSRSWHPSRQHDFVSGFAAGSISLGVETGMNIVNEFLPDVLRTLHLQRK